MRKFSIATLAGLIALVSHLPLSSLRAEDQFVIHTRLIEVNQNKLKSLGLDLTTLVDDGSVTSTQTVELNSFEDMKKVAGAVSPSAFSELLEALGKTNIVRVLSDSKVAVSAGRQASLSTGNTVKADGDSTDGNNEGVFLGTKIDVHAEPVGDHRVRIHLKHRWSGIAELTVTPHATTPKINVREIDTGFETEIGQTWMVLGPLLEAPAANQTEIALLVTPELASGDGEAIR